MHLPLTTPFTPDGRLHLRKLEQNVAHYSLTPAAGMVVLGRTGEGELLSGVERLEVLRTAIDAALPVKVMMAGIGEASVRGALAAIEDAAAMGYDAAVVRLPVTSGTGEQREVRVFFQMVADGAALPVVLAGAAGFAGAAGMELVVEMASHARVLGWLDAGSEPERVRSVLARTAAVKRTVTVTQVFAAVTGRMLAGQIAEGLVSVESLTGNGAVLVAPGKTAVRTRTKVVGFQVLMGGTETMLAGLAAGAVGAVPPFGAAAPQGCYEVMAAWKDGDPGLAEEKQLRLVEAARRIEGELGVAGLKYGCDLNGYFGGVRRLPGLPLTGAERAEVEGLMAGLKS